MRTHRGLWLAWESAALPPMRVPLPRARTATMDIPPMHVRHMATTGHAGFQVAPLSAPVHGSTAITAGLDLSADQVSAPGWLLTDLPTSDGR